MPPLKKNAKSASQQVLKLETQKVATLASQQVDTLATTASNTDQEVTFESRNESIHPQKKKVTLAKKAGLVFPPSRFKRYMKKALLAKHIGVGAGVYCAAAIEYLVAEVMELSGNAAHDNKRKIIKPRHILLAVRNDEELDKVLKNVTISEGGILPNINPILLPKRTLKKQKNNDSKPKSSEKNASNATMDQDDDNTK